MTSKRRAIVVMFDSLNRRYLPPYGGQTPAPNFDRLAARSIRFEQSYAGSLPCMPARRELHTGRYNFLHRGWGPLEPFDDSVPAMLGQEGIATHLATDHMHYWEDGGATYHTRYGTYTLVRGQQGDPWKGSVADPIVGDDLRVHRSGTWRQDRVNRAYIDGLHEYPQTLTFDAGLEFIEANADAERWFVQIETFDPHEPFNAAVEFRRMFDVEGEGSPDYDWPDYQQVLEDPKVAERVRRQYQALVAQCDASLGRVLDLMDEREMWDDTLLIVCTDHGFLLGEQGWWGKAVPPWYDQTVHTPLFLHDPDQPVTGDTASDDLVQTIDIGPTLLDYFGIPVTAHMQGRSIRPTAAATEPPREYALFGAFGGHVSVTDGRYVYMRASATASNAPLHEHTLMPTHMRGFFTGAELSSAELHEGFSFTKGMPVLRTDAAAMGNPFQAGTMLFDLEADPEQATPLVNDDLELRMATGLRDMLIASEAPPSQFVRLGLPTSGPLRTDDLLCRAQMSLVQASRTPVPAIDSFPDAPLGVRTTVAELLEHPGARQIMQKYAKPVHVALFGRVFNGATLYRAAAALLGPAPWDRLRELAHELASLSEDEPESLTATVPRAAPDRAR